MLNPESLHSNIERAFVQNDQSAIAKFYTANFIKVRSYVLKNSGSEQDAKDIYQEAFLVLWRKITEGVGNIKSDSDASGFLYQVSKFKWLDHLGSSKVRLRSSLTEDNALMESEIELDHDYERKLKDMLAALKLLGSQCKELITLFYYARQSMEEIGNKMNLDAASARNQKYRCMKQLRQLVTKKK